VLCQQCGTTSSRYIFKLIVPDPPPRTHTSSTHPDPRLLPLTLLLLLTLCRVFSLSRSRARSLVAALSRALVPPAFLAPYKFSLSLLLFSLSQADSLALCFSLSLSLFFSLSLPLSPSRFLSHSLSRSLPRSLFRSLSRPLWLALPFSLAHSLSFSCFRALSLILCLFLTHPLSVLLPVTHACTQVLRAVSSPVQSHIQDLILQTFEIKCWLRLACVPVTARQCCSSDISSSVILHLLVFSSTEPPPPLHTTYIYTVFMRFRSCPSSAIRPYINVCIFMYVFDSQISLFPPLHPIYICIVLYAFQKPCIHAFQKPYKCLCVSEAAFFPPFHLTYT